MIKELIAEQGITVVFQPLVEVSTGDIFAYETLVRCSAEEFRAPPVLIQAAIDAGMIGVLGRLIRELAVEGCPDHTLFLNIDPNEFAEEYLVRPDDPSFSHEHGVYLEITESVPLSHYEQCHDVLKEIRQRGLKLAVDDLGAGYSNLKYIADLSPEIVKLDRELIKGLVIGTRLFRLVEAIVNMCIAMGAKVVAEGVETLEEYNAVSAAGAHYVQGYFFARPASPPPEVDAAEVIAKAT